RSTATRSRTPSCCPPSARRTAGVLRVNDRSVVPFSFRSSAWFSGAIIALAVIAAYSTGLRTPFQYDDLSTIVENDSIRRLSDLHLALSPPANATPTSGRPLLNLSFAIDYAITGLNVIGYHATNIALHL